MAYTIEISLNNLKYSNINDLQCNLFYIADKYNYDQIYQLEDSNGIHSITVISFLKNQIQTLTHFIKEIKKHKSYFIECIYEDNIKTKLIYATDFYLKTIDKSLRIDYTNFKRNRSYSEDETLLLREIKVY